MLAVVTDAWRWSAITGITLGLVAFAALFIPILVWQSLRFGRVRGVRTFAAGAAAVYGVTILAYTLLPLPAPDWCLTHGNNEHYFRPFHSAGEIARAIDGLSARDALRSFTVLQVVMNVFLFVPWGAFWRRLFGRSIVVAGLSGVVASVLIEASQFTGLWGSYDCAYRVADIDDVITNSLGAFIGAVAAPLVLWWLPTTDADIDRRAEPRPVTRGRRIAGMAIDAFAFFGVWATVSMALLIIDRYELARPLRTEGGWRDQTVPGVIAFVVVVLLPAVLGSGASVGQRAMWLRPDPALARTARGALRLLTGFGGYALLHVASSVPSLPRGLQWAITAVTATMLVVAVASVVFDATARGVSFRVARSTPVDTRSPA